MPRPPAGWQHGEYAVRADQGLKQGCVTSAPVHSCDTAIEGPARWSGTVGAVNEQRTEPGPLAWHCCPPRTCAPLVEPDTSPASGRRPHVTRERAWPGCAHAAFTEARPKRHDCQLIGLTSGRRDAACSRGCSRPRWGAPARCTRRCCAYWPAAESRHVQGVALDV